MFFSIIIPTYNRQETLAICLDKLKRSIQQFDDFEVIVSDDGDVTKTINILKDKLEHVSFLQGPRKGPAANRNNGAKNAKGEWLIFLDDDCIPDTDLLNGYKMEVEKYASIKAFEGRIYVNNKRTRLDEESPVNETGGLFWSCNIMVESELFNNIGGFDEDYPYACMEDIDLRERIGKSNIQFAKNAAVLHPWRRINNFNSIYKKKCLSHRIFLAKHPEYPNFQKSSYIKNVMFSTKENIIQMFKFNFRGYKYNLYLLKFQYRFLVYLLLR